MFDMELDKKYTFRTVGYLTINGEDVNTLDIQLSPKEVGEIRDWFQLRDMKWIGHIPLEFRKHSPELYDKLYQELVNLYNESDIDPYELSDLPYEEMEDDCTDEIEYDCTIDPSDDDCPWGCLLWPIQLFEEMGILVPNASVWVTAIDAKSDFDAGMGYPIYLEENYLEELKIILEATVWNVNFKKWSVDINNLADKHTELRNIIEQRLKDVLISTYNYKEKDLTTLRFSLYELSINRNYNPLTGK